MPDRKYWKSKDKDVMCQNALLAYSSVATLGFCNLNTPLSMSRTKALRINKSLLTSVTKLMLHTKQLCGDKFEKLFDTTKFQVDNALREVKGSLP